MSFQKLKVHGKQFDRIINLCKDSIEETQLFILTISLWLRGGFYVRKTKKEKRRFSMSSQYVIKSRMFLRSNILKINYKIKPDISGS